MQVAEKKEDPKSQAVSADWGHMIRFYIPLCLLLFGAINIAGCDNVFTKPPPEGDDFETPFEGLSFDLNKTFAQGDENFERVFTVQDGLGPIFNNTGCESCHPGDGRGTDAEAFARFSQGNDLAFDIGGPQHQNRSIPGIPVETIPAGVDTSLRLPPPVFGVGLIEHIPIETILSNADENDTNGDGISGRPNWVTAPDYVPFTEVGGGPGQQLGRFSRKAQVSSLIQQVAEAYQQDIGITSDFIPVENAHPQAGGFAVGDRVPDPEIPASTVLQTVVYVRLLAHQSGVRLHQRSSVETPSSRKSAVPLVISQRCGQARIPFHS